MSEEVPKPIEDEKQEAAVEAEKSATEAEEQAGKGDEEVAYSSTYAHKKHDMVLDPDGDTMTDAEGGRALLKITPPKQVFSKQFIMVGLILICGYGIIGAIAAIAAGYSTEHEVDNRIKDTGSAFDFHDGANYGYQDTAVGEEDITTATDETADTTAVNPVDINEPIVTGDVIIPPMIDETYVDMFQTAEDGSLFLTPYERMSGEVPVFFRVPNSGARLESVLSGCVKAVLASTIGAADGRDEEDFLRVVNIGNRAFVNVDLSQTTGIERASQLDLGASGLADVFVSPHLHYTTNQLLSYPDHKGRMFTVLRHPVERAIARHASFIRQHQPDMPDADATLASMSLVDWAQSEYSSKNWLIRFLVNKRTGLILAEDVQVAKEILRKKCLIGLYDRIWTSMERVERYFGWFKDNQIERECHQNQITHTRDRDAADYMLEDELDDANFDIGSEAYELLVKNNDYDMEVYWYAVGLFDEQGKLFPPSSW